MLKTSPQKQKIFLLSRFLFEYSDMDHPVSVTQCIEHLASHGIHVERKSLYTDMEALQSLGVDIQCRKGKQGGWYWGERPFQLSELKLIVDAVQAYPYITLRKCNALVKKLATLTSVHRAPQLHRPIHVDYIVQTMSDSIYPALDKLHFAITNGRVIMFKYFALTADKERELHREGKRYLFTPHCILWNNRQYFLVGYDHSLEKVCNYSVAQMTDISITALPREGDLQMAGMDVSGYANLPFMAFRGEGERVTMSCCKSHIGDLIHRFGNDLEVISAEGETVICAASVAVNFTFFGWVFSLGNVVTVTEPQWVKDAYLEHLKNTLHHNLNTENQ